MAHRVSTPISRRWSTAPPSGDGSYSRSGAPVLFMSRGWTMSRARHTRNPAVCEPALVRQFGRLRSQLGRLGGGLKMSKANLMRVGRLLPAAMLPVAGALISSAALGVGCGQGSGASVIEQPPNSSSSGSSSGGNTSSGSSSGGNASSGSSSGGMSSSGSSRRGGDDGGTGDDGGPPPDSWGTPVAGGPTGSGTAATVTVTPGTTMGAVSNDFVGFSYEKTHITNDSLNSTNTDLVALYNLLTTSGS